MLGHVEAMLGQVGAMLGNVGVTHIQTMLGPS